MANDTVAAAASFSSSGYIPIYSNTYKQPHFHFEDKNPAKYWNIE